MKLCILGSIVEHLCDLTRTYDLSCRRWSCPECCEDRAAELVRLAVAGKPTHFITLTCQPRLWPSPADAARAMQDARAELVRRIRKLGPSFPFEYFSVWEATKAGWPHLHILARTDFIDQAWLSVTWSELTGAPIVDIRRVHQLEDAASYVAKYVGKDPHHFGTNNRYSRSRNWCQSKAQRKRDNFVPGLVRFFVKGVYSNSHELAHLLSGLGLDVIESGDGWAWLTGPPHHLEVFR